MDFKHLYGNERYFLNKMDDATSIFLKCNNSYSRFYVDYHSLIVDSKVGYQTDAPLQGVNELIHKHALKQQKNDKFWLSWAQSCDVPTHLHLKLKIWLIWNAF